VGWGEHVEGGVPALAVVERLDVFEHGGLQLEPVGPGAAVDELFFEGGEERLRDGVDAPMFVKSWSLTLMLKLMLLSERVPFPRWGRRGRAG
jgi:hypothetical protein